MFESHHSKRCYDNVAKHDKEFFSSFPVEKSLDWGATEKQYDKQAKQSESSSTSLKWILKLNDNHLTHEAKSPDSEQHEPQLYRLQITKSYSEELHMCDLIVWIQLEYEQVIHFVLSENHDHKCCGEKNEYDHEKESKSVEWS